MDPRVEETRAGRLGGRAAPCPTLCQPLPGTTASQCPACSDFCFTPIPSPAPFSCKRCSCPSLKAAVRARCHLVAVCPPTSPQLAFPGTSPVAPAAAPSDASFTASAAAGASSVPATAGGHRSRAVCCQAPPREWPLQITTCCCFSQLPTPALLAAVSSPNSGKDEFCQVAWVCAWAKVLRAQLQGKLLPQHLGCQKGLPQLPHFFPSQLLIWS